RKQKGRLQNEAALLLAWIRLPAVFAPAAAAAEATAATRAAAVSAALGARAGHVNVECASVHFAAVQGIDGGIALGVVFHLHEPEAARTASVTIGHDANP